MGGKTKKTEFHRQTDFFSQLENGPIFTQNGWVISLRRVNLKDVLAYIREEYPRKVGHFLRNWLKVTGFFTKGGFMNFVDKKALRSTISPMPESHSSLFEITFHETKLRKALLSEMSKALAEVNKYLSAYYFHVPLESLFVWRFKPSDSLPVDMLCLHSTCFEKNSYLPKVNVMVMIYSEASRIRIRQREWTKEEANRRQKEFIKRIQSSGYLDDPFQGDDVCEKIRDMLFSEKLIDEGFSPLAPVSKLIDFARDTVLPKLVCPVCGMEFRQMRRDQTVCYKEGNACKMRKMRWGKSIRALLEERPELTKSEIVRAMREREAEIREKLLRKNRESDFRPVHDMERLVEIILEEVRPSK